MPEPITQSRAFCEKLLELNRTYTRQDIDNISVRVDRDVWKYRGGWYTNPETHATTPYCRHEWVQQIAIKRPAVDTTQPEEPLIQVGTVTINTVNEGKQFAKQVIEEALGTNVGQVKVARDMTPAKVQKYVEAIQKITNEYNTNQEVKDSIVVSLSSTKGSYGFVRPAYRAGTGNRIIEITEINLGNKTSPFSERNPAIRVREVNGRIVNSGKSSVDEANLELATAVHEMGHVIAWKYSKTPNVEAYFNELKGIRTEYYKEINTLIKDRNLTELNKVSLGEYANKNLDEFHAEAWTEYRLNSNPSKYAKQVGELIDKYFKK